MLYAMYFAVTWASPSDRVGEVNQAISYPTPNVGRIMWYGPGPHVSSPVLPVPWTRKTIPPGLFWNPLGKVMTLASSLQERL